MARKPCLKSTNLQRALIIQPIYSFTAKWHWKAIQETSNDTLVLLKGPEALSPALQICVRAYINVTLIWGVLFMSEER